MPKKVDEIKKKVQKQNPSYDESKAWATAWSIYCKHVNPESDSCKRPPSGYLKKKKSKKKANSMYCTILKLAKEYELNCLSLSS